MRTFFAVCILFIIALIQSLLLFKITSWPWTPDLLLIAIVFFCLRAGWRKGLVIGVCAGIFIDTFTVGRFGAYILTYGLTGICLGLVTYKLYFENPVTQSLIVFIATIGTAVTYFSLYSIFFGISLWPLLFTRVIAQSFSNGIWAIIIFFILWRFEQKRLFNI
ncbi:MAG: rod shape-determining protein MreD [Candidatus Ancaeobacter aquaticus]|nr:rod shape-determining protein MreD [Candidatus Ancaeobacter aquaticus]